MGKYKVIISQKAVNMLKEHILFLAQVDKNAAEKTRVKLISAFTSLEEMPNRYPLFNAPYIPKNRYRKMYVENWYLVLYQVKESIVYVDYVVDCRRDYQWLQKD